MALFAFLTVEELAPMFVFVAIMAGTFWLLTSISNRNSQAEERLAASHTLLETISRALVGFIGHSNPSVTLHHLLSRVLSLTERR